MLQHPRRRNATESRHRDIFPASVEQALHKTSHNSAASRAKIKSTLGGTNSLKPGPISHASTTQQGNVIVPTQSPEVSAKAAESYFAALVWIISGVDECTGFRAR
jgi:hypothetical protein